MWLLGAALWGWVVVILVGLVIYEFGWIVGIILFLLICYKMLWAAERITIKIKIDDR